MKVELKIDKNLKETKMVVYSNELNDEIVDFVNKLQNYNSVKTIIGYLDGKSFILNRDEIESFFTEDSKVYARKENKKYRIKRKLYELVELLEGTSFVRISNYEITNFDKVESLEINVRHLICLKYKSGEITYVSRRYVSKIKKYLNI